MVTSSALADLPLAGGVTTAGLNAHVTPAGRPEQDRPTAALKPRRETTVQMPVALLAGRRRQDRRAARDHEVGRRGDVERQAGVRVRPPPMAMAWKAVVPSGVAAEVLTVSVLSTNPFGGGVTSAGLKAHEAPAGNVAHDRLTGALKVLTDVTRQVLMTLLPCATDRLAGVQDSVKLGSSTLISSWRARQRAAGADDLEGEQASGRGRRGVRVRVLVALPFGGGVTGVALKLQDAPAGRLAQARSTGALNPFCDATVQVLLALLPWTAETMDGKQATVKAGASTVRVRLALRSSAPLMPRTWKLVAPPGVVSEVPTVSVLVMLPFAGGVTRPG